MGIFSKDDDDYAPLWTRCPKARKKHDAEYRKWREYRKKVAQMQRKIEALGAEAYDTKRGKPNPDA